MSQTEHIYLQHGLDDKDACATKAGAASTVPCDVLVHTVETLVQTKVHRLTLVASLNAVSIARRWEGATDDLFEHSLPEIGTCCAAEKCG